MKLRGAKLQFYEKKLFHMFSFMYFASTSKEALKVCVQSFFQGI